LYRQGFQPCAYHIYDLDRYGLGSYLSDRDKHKRDINEPLSEYLKNKRKFYKPFEDRRISVYLPDLYGAISGDRIRGRI